MNTNRTATHWAVAAERSLLRIDDELDRRRSDEKLDKAVNEALLAMSNAWDVTVTRTDGSEAARYVIESRDRQAHVDCHDGDLFVSFRYVEGSTNIESTNPHLVGRLIATALQGI